MMRQKKNFSGSQNSKSNGLERNLQKLYAAVKFQMIKKIRFIGTLKSWKRIGHTTIAIDSKTYYSIE